MTDVDYRHDITLLLNTPDQEESLLHIQEQAPGSIGMYVEVNKTVFFCFKWEAVISIFSGRPLKEGSNISSTESKVNILQLKAWTPID